MIKLILTILSILMILGSIFWIYSEPAEIEPKITLIASFIGFFSLVRYGSKRSKKIPKISFSVKSDTQATENAVQSINSVKVFISYAHDSEDHKKSVLNLANKLNRIGIECWIDRYVEDNPPERGWPHWMEEKIRNSNYILIVCCSRY